MMVHFKAVHEPFYSDDRFRSLYENQELPEPDDLLWPESPKGKVFKGREDICGLFPEIQKFCYNSGEGRSESV